jgi:3-oxoacyl-[acyl-carrier-protein] synthase-3
MRVPFSTERVSISGTGSCVPERIVTNEDLASSVSTTPEWVLHNLGIKERRITAPGQLTSHLAISAARLAMDNAKVAVSDIDLIIVATATPDRQAPSTACIVQEQLGVVGCPAFDVAAVCSGFIYAMGIASQFVHDGSCRHALVIGADAFSQITDWSRRDCVFFGDGAGAAILSRADDDTGFYTTILHADGRGKDNFTVYPGDESFTMNGRAVYEKGSQVIPQAIGSLLLHHDLRPEDISIMIPHQPSLRLLQNAAKGLGLPFEKVATNMDRYANTSGATIPLLLDEVHKAGRLRTNDLLAFAAVGSGWTWGAALYRWR